jgi:hypothetical protein
MLSEFNESYNNHFTFIVLFCIDNERVCYAEDNKFTKNERGSPRL